MQPAERSPFRVNIAGRLQAGIGSLLPTTVTESVTELSISASTIDELLVFQQQLGLVCTHSARCAAGEDEGFDLVHHF